MLSGFLISARGGIVSLEWLTRYTSNLYIKESKSGINGDQRIRV
jgi:hypothetical protein